MATDVPDDDAQPPGAEPVASTPAGRAVLNVALALATAVLCGAGFYEARVPADAEVLRAKREHWREHADQYSVVFLGTSLTFRSISPEVFDEEMARYGRDVRSYNFGVMGMGTHEADHVLREILATEPANLRWAFLEADEWRTQVSEGDQKTDRFIDWHSATSMRLLLDSLSVARQPWTQSLLEAGKHALHVFYKYTSVGRGPRTVRTWLGLEAWERPEEEAFVETTRGFEPLRLDTDDPDLRARRERFERREEHFRTEIQRTRAMNEHEGGLDHYNVAAVREQVEVLRAHGVEPIHVILPIPEPRLAVWRAAADGVIPTLFAFNDPERFGGLFRPERFFDSRHLEERSALQFTRLLARRFAEHLAELDGEGEVTGRRVDDEPARPDDGDAR